MENQEEQEKLRLSEDCFYFETLIDVISSTLFFLGVKIGRDVSRVNQTTTPLSDEDMEELIVFSGASSTVGGLRHYQDIEDLLVSLQKDLHHVERELNEMKRKMNHYYR
ncbi:hypothetical protein JCM19047_4467 [Bacillus sp. JCM 19047]|uniref:Uncharacterized protein n=1 Tax=Shouchella miscanthi TaxID=2598861 RepID=A0ABU6NRN1_9BACI|nr:hypothetical protein [Shouchella miscanthi]MED4130591.1 hypothetical protein [Shouchella miscanthi]GAF24551.1 hypothetical protein JCM19047_4467 [Bacillus sp. JCM 19047]